MTRENETVSVSDCEKLITLIKQGNIIVGEPHPDPFINAVWCLIYSMTEMGVKGDDPWWGEDFLAVKRMLEKNGLNCDPSKTD